MKVVLLLIMFLTVACGGGGDYSFGTSAYTPPNYQQETVANIQSDISGTPVFSVPNQMTIIRDKSDYEFYHRLLTGNETVLAESILSTNDVLMIVNTPTSDQGKFNIDQVTLTGNTILNVYHYYTDTISSSQKYNIYFVDKTYSNPNFIEIVK
jgi:hypothetical protein